MKFQSIFLKVLWESLLLHFVINKYYLALNMHNGGLIAGLIVYPVCTWIVYFTITLTLEIGIINYNS